MEVPSLELRRSPMLEELINISGRTTTRSTVTSKSPHPGLSDRLSTYFKQAGAAGHETSFSDSESSVPVKSARINEFGHRGRKEFSSRYSSLVFEDQLGFSDLTAKLPTPQLGSPEAPRALEHESLSPKQGTLKLSCSLLKRSSDFHISDDSLAQLFKKPSPRKKKQPKIPQRAKTPQPPSRTSIQRRTLPASAKKSSLYTTPRAGIKRNILTSKEVPSRQGTRSPLAGGDDMVEKCEKSVKHIKSKMERVETGLADGGGLKEFQLSIILRKLRQVERLLGEVEEKCGGGGGTTRGVSPFKLGGVRRLPGRDLKKIVKRSRYPAQKKVFELVKRLRGAIPNLIIFCLRAGAQQRAPPVCATPEVSICSRSFLSSCGSQISKHQRSSFMEGDDMVSKIVKQAVKNAAGRVKAMETTGLAVPLFMAQAGIKVTPSGESIILLRRQKEYLQTFQAKNATISSKIVAGLAAGGLLTVRKQTKQAITLLGQIEKLISKELCKSKREKTKDQLRSQWRTCLIWLGWAQVLSDQNKKARDYFSRAYELPQTTYLGLLLDYGLFLTSPPFCITAGPGTPLHALQWMTIHATTTMNLELNQAGAIVEELSNGNQEVRVLLFLILYQAICEHPTRTLAFIEGCVHSLPNGALKSYLQLHGLKLQAHGDPGFDMAGAVQQLVGESGGEDGVYLLFEYAKAVIRAQLEDGGQALRILDQLKLVKGVTGTASIEFWRGRYFANIHCHALAAKLFSEVYEGLSANKQGYVRLHRLEIERLQETIRVAALNRDTIKKTAPAFSDLEPFWEEVLHLCLRRPKLSLERVQALVQKYQQRFEARFLLWATTLKFSSAVDALEILREMETFSEFDSDHLAVDPALLFCLMQVQFIDSGKNYGEKMTRHQVLGLMRLKTNLHLDLGRAAAMLHELLAVYTQLPILHYFTLVVAHKQLRAESSSDWDLEELERHALKTEEGLPVARKAKCGLLWAEVVYMCEGEWKSLYRKARDWLLAQDREELLEKPTRVIDHARYKYKL